MGQALLPVSEPSALLPFAQAGAPVLRAAGSFLWRERPARRSEGIVPARGTGTLPRQRAGRPRYKDRSKATGNRTNTFASGRRFP